MKISLYVLMLLCAHVSLHALIIQNSLDEKVTWTLEPLESVTGKPQLISFVSKLSTLPKTQALFQPLKNTSTPFAINNAFRITVTMSGYVAPISLSLPPQHTASLDDIIDPSDVVMLDKHIRTLEGSPKPKVSSSEGQESCTFVIGSEALTVAPDIAILHLDATDPSGIPHLWVIDPIKWRNGGDGYIVLDIAPEKVSLSQDHIKAFREKALPVSLEEKEERQKRIMRLLPVSSDRMQEYKEQTSPKARTSRATSVGITAEDLRGTSAVRGPSARKLKKEAAAAK